MMNRHGHPGLPSLALEVTGELNEPTSEMTRPLINKAEERLQPMPANAGSTETTDAANDFRNV
jgi:hypothetical protein